MNYLISWAHCVPLEPPQSFTAEVMLDEAEPRFATRSDMSLAHAVAFPLQSPIAFATSAAALPMSVPADVRSATHEARACNGSEVMMATQATRRRKPDCCIVMRSRDGPCL